MSMGRMSWESPNEPQWMPDWDCWWQQVLETDWATEQEILQACGPEYFFAWRDLEGF